MGHHVCGLTLVGGPFVRGVVKMLEIIPCWAH